jgi:hypothetical protein
VNSPLVVDVVEVEEADVLLVVLVAGRAVQTEESENVYTGVGQGQLH